MCVNVAVFLVADTEKADDKQMTVGKVSRSESSDDYGDDD